MPELLADGVAPADGAATIENLVDAVILMTHRLHDAVEDAPDPERSAEVNDLRGRRRRVKLAIIARAEASAPRPPKPRCPVHGIPDCSPLLNGCSWRPDGDA